MADANNLPELMRLMGFLRRMFPKPAGLAHHEWSIRLNILMDYVGRQGGLSVPAEHKALVVDKFKDQAFHPYRLGATLYMHYRLLNPIGKLKGVTRSTSRDYADKVTAIALGRKCVEGATSVAKNLARNRPHYASATAYWAALFVIAGKPTGKYSYFQEPQESLDAFLAGLGLDASEDANRFWDNPKIDRFVRLSKLFETFNMDFQQDRSEERWFGRRSEITDSGDDTLWSFIDTNVILTAERELAEAVRGRIA